MDILKLKGVTRKVKPLLLNGLGSSMETTEGRTTGLSDRSIVFAHLLKGEKTNGKKKKMESVGRENSRRSNTHADRIPEVKRGFGLEASQSNNAANFPNVENKRHKPTSSKS